ncbi:MAG TPA: hypothetical protein VGI92_00470 [Gemmatimonadales bacterium]|jgi:hypothetical protein
MSTTTFGHEPLGIVIQDGGHTLAAPRIMMWYWANEDEMPASERLEA